MKLYYIKEVKVKERPALRINKKKGLHIVKMPVIKKVKVVEEIEERIEYNGQ